MPPAKRAAKTVEPDTTPEAADNGTSPGPVEPAPKPKGPTSDSPEDCKHGDDQWALVGSKSNQGRYTEVTERCRLCGGERTRSFDADGNETD